MRVHQTFSVGVELLATTPISPAEEEDLRRAIEDLNGYKIEVLQEQHAGIDEDGRRQRAGHLL